MSAAIPEGVPDSLKNSFRGSLQYGNEKSLRHRMRRILREFSEKTGRLICNVNADFIHGVVQTRNHLTHNLPVAENGVLRGSEIHFASDKTRVLTLVLLLKRIGLEEDLICKCLERNSSLAFQRMHYLNAREK